MTVSTQYQPLTFKPGAAMTAEAIPWQFLAGEQIVVTHIEAVTAAETVLVLGDDYSISGSGPDGTGSVTALAAWPVNDDFRVERATSLEQEYELPPFEAIRSSALERENDRQLMALQEQEWQQSDIDSRSVSVARGEVAPDLDIAGLIEGDILEYRGGKFRRFLREAFAGKFFAGDASGRPVPASGFGADAGLRPDLATSSGASLISWIRAATGAVARTIADWFSDHPSIMDYIPAVERVKVRLRTSTADLSPYFLAASGAGKAFIVPEGSYRLAHNVGFAQRVTFMPGAQLYRDGGSLAFSGGIAAPIAEQIFHGYVYPQIDINNDLSPEGWVDWFGYDVNAIETCHAIFHINRLGPRDYFTDRTVILDKSYREVIGSRGSAEGAGGTRIVMIGAAAANQPLVQVGTLNSTAVLSCARRLNIRYINTIRAGATYQPVASGRREDAIPGWNIKGWYEGHMEDCFDYGSAIHYKINATIGCTLIRCGGVRPGAGAANGNPDFYTAFVVGGYSTSFGFIGANASITIDSCGTAGGTGNASMGLFLYGFIGDTWIKKFEDSQLPYGIFVDGADVSGTPVTSLSAHQDVRIRECILDAHTFNCLTVQNINAGGAISLDDNYLAQNAAGDTVLINNCRGLLSINSGDIIANSSLANFGVRIAGSKRVTVGPAVKIKDCRVGVRAESSGQLRIEANITRANTGGTNAVELAGVGRSFIQPIVDADVAAFNYGISADIATNYSELNISGINYGCFTTVTAGRKIRYDGATWGGGGTFGNNNIVTGVLT